MLKFQHNLLCGSSPFLPTTLLLTTTCCFPWVVENPSLVVSLCGVGIATFSQKVQYISKRFAMIAEVLSAHSHK